MAHLGPFSPVCFPSAPLHPPAAATRPAKRELGLRHPWTVQMSDWDASEPDQAAAAAPLPRSVVPAGNKSKWADEDADEEVKDDWEASDDGSDALAKQSVGPAKPAAPIRNKGITKLKIAEKEAQEASKLAELQALAEEANDPMLRKKKEQRMAVEADMENARGLFGNAVISTGAEDPLTMNPTTKGDFEAFSTALAELIVTKHGNKPLYATFVEHFVRQISGPLSDVQTRKAASALTTLSNEKQKQAKDSKKGGKAKAKPALGGLGSAGSTLNKGRRGGDADLEVYDQALDDDFDDFM